MLMEEEMLDVLLLIFLCVFFGLSFLLIRGIEKVKE
jgi:hypothetical protein